MSRLLCLSALMFSFAHLGACFMPTACAEDVAKVFEAREFQPVKDGPTLKYRILSPLDYDANVKYPVVLFLHGAGERGDNNVAQLKHCMDQFATEETRKKYPAFIIAPQCPTQRKWVEVDWSAAKHDMPEKSSEPLGLSFQLLKQLQEKYSIDADRIYVSGLSMGGYGTWDALQRHPDYFAAGIPICGGGDVKGAEAMKNIPIWCFHGDADNAVPVKRSRDMIEAIKAAGGEPKYTEYPGVGHDSWTATYKNPEVIAWLFAQKRTEKK